MGRQPDRMRGIIRSLTFPRRISSKSTQIRWKKGNASTAVLDFAKTLLFDLKTAIDQRAGNLNIGAVPLLFVVHSMGGLIVKEVKDHTPFLADILSYHDQAYMQGQNDPQYENIGKAISAILFLATPHRGSNLADILHRVLEATWLTNSKFYVSELSSDSFTLQKLNEQFRHIAPRLNIVSFYETQPTSIGAARVMILEIDSPVVGYPGEIYKALDADHHGVCKYENRHDPNYITVRNALKSIVSKIISASGPKDKAFRAAGARTTWDRLFNSILFKMKDGPLFWVIDGLDEADDARSVIKLFSDLEHSTIPIRVLLLGRPISEITRALAKISPSIRQGAIRIDGHVEDFYAHIRRELSMSAGADFKQSILQRKVAGAQNNFLWVR
ncbi:hypothetical protein BDW74DRAFT_181909 [Aspergillus multicolor]|uniref:uncharacterized protein n=1 Tax=Aspergillus multicolor TaxID=41759 RepID=UPI003CCCA010